MVTETMVIAKTITGIATLAITIIPKIIMEMVKTAIPRTAIVAATALTQIITTTMVIILIRYFNIQRLNIFGNF